MATKNLFRCNACSAEFDLTIGSLKSKKEIRCWECDNRVLTDWSIKDFPNCPACAGQMKTDLDPMCPTCKKRDLTVLKVLMRLD